MGNKVGKSCLAKRIISGKYKERESSNVDDEDEVSSSKKYNELYYRLINYNSREILLELEELKKKPLNLQDCENSSDKLLKDVLYRKDGNILFENGIRGYLPAKYRKIIGLDEIKVSNDDLLCKNRMAIWLCYNKRSAQSLVYVQEALKIIDKSHYIVLLVQTFTDIIPSEKNMKVEAKGREIAEFNDIPLFTVSNKSMIGI